MGLAADSSTILFLVGSAVTSFVTTLFATRWLIRRLKGTTMVGRDLHKIAAPPVPEMGGLAVMAGFYVGVTVLQLIGPNDVAPAYFHSSLLAILGAGFVGLLDDLFNLRQRMKALLPFLFAVPLGIVAFRDPAGRTLLSMDIGWLIILVIPFGITSAANAANMLEGFNGLGAGLGLIISAALIALAFITGEPAGLYFVLPLAGALIAFLHFNRYPARVFPGDTMTLFMGATIAAAAIVAHQKTYGALLFVPMIIEFILKGKGRFRGENYGDLNGDGRLSYAGSIESLAHALMKGRRLTEQQVVLTLWAIEGGIGVAVVLAAAAGL